MAGDDNKTAQLDNIQEPKSLLQESKQVKADLPPLSYQSYQQPPNRYEQIRAPLFHLKPPDPVSVEDVESSFESFAKNTTFHGFNQVCGYIS